MVARINLRAVAAAILCCLLAGCGGNGGVQVTGTVTFDGQPVEEGAISFVGTGEKPLSQGAVIKGGKFDAILAPGPKRVEIRASRPKKPDPRDPDSARMREDFIPAKFNSASRLTAEIVAGKENSLKFDLLGK
jgi:hypothetical protein